jgi:hypothetical protein
MTLFSTRLFHILKKAAEAAGHQAHEFSPACKQGQQPHEAAD